MNCDKTLEELWPSWSPKKVSKSDDDYSNTAVSTDDWSFYELIKSGDKIEIEKALRSGDAQSRLSLLVTAFYQNRLDLVEFIVGKYEFNESEFFQIAKSFVDNREVANLKFMLNKKLIELDVDLFEYIEKDLGNWSGKNYDKAEMALFEMLKNARRKAKINLICGSV